MQKMSVQLEILGCKGLSVCHHLLDVIYAEYTVSPQQVVPVYMRGNRCGVCRVEGVLSVHMCVKSKIKSHFICHLSHVICPIHVFSRCYCGCSEMLVFLALTVKQYITVIFNNFTTIHTNLKKRN